MTAENLLHLPEPLSRTTRSGLPEPLVKLKKTNSIVYMLDGTKRRLYMGVGDAPVYKARKTEAKGGTALICRFGDKVWVDKELAKFPQQDYRLFVGNISNEVSNARLKQGFAAYKSVVYARVVRRTSGRGSGYGFVSMTDSDEFLRALDEMQGAFIGSKRVQLKRSTWHHRLFDSTANKRLKVLVKGVPLVNELKKKRLM